MEFLKAISPKAIAIGFVGGYCVPFIVLKVLGYALITFGINELFGYIAIVIIVLITVLSPMASGYLGAKYSKALPLMNGALATTIGVASFFITGQMGSMFIYILITSAAILFGYVGVKRYINFG